MNKILYNSVLHVNLEQLRRNVRTLLGELEGKELIPVLKGNAYGLGLERIGRELAAFEEIHKCLFQAKKNIRNLQNWFLIS